MIEVSQENGSKRKTPLIIEVVGPAGTGKTTLIQALSQSNEKILIGANLALRKKEHILIFAGYAPFLLPSLLRRDQHSRKFTWEEIKTLVYVKTWPRVLNQQMGNHGNIVLLDHGPIFRLASLLGFGPNSLKDKRYEKWWNEVIKQLSSTLDMVIWLDAPDTILAERINCRSQKHKIKGKSEIEASDFLAKYRISLMQILSKLIVYGEPTILEFDAGELSTDQIMDEVLEFLKSIGN
jgi:shikimate kinase